MPRKVLLIIIYISLLNTVHLILLFYLIYNHIIILPFLSFINGSTTTNLFNSILNPIPYNQLDHYFSQLCMSWWTLLTSWIRHATLSVQPSNCLQRTIKVCEADCGLLLSLIPFLGASCHIQWFSRKPSPEKWSKKKLLFAGNLTHLHLSFLNVDPSLDHENFKLF